MLYKLTDNDKLKPKEFLTLSDIGKLEKDLENIISINMFETIYSDEPLLPIFQERCFQPEQDITAMDAEGNIIVFELKRYNSDDYTIAQIFRYVQMVQRWDYKTIEEKFKKYKSIDDSNFSFKDYHQEIFNLQSPLDEKEFNSKQKMIIIANCLDTNLKNSIFYWQSKGIEVDFIPYRIYKFNNQLYFEIFTKPFDIHANPKDIQGIIFDTNRSYDENAVNYMFQKNRVSSFGDRKEAVYCFKKNDYVFFSHKFVGIVAVGKIVSSIKNGNYDEQDEELYADVNILKKSETINVPLLSYSKIFELIGKKFYHARIDKRPYLNFDETKILLKELNVHIE